MPEYPHSEVRFFFNFVAVPFFPLNTVAMRCVIWYHLYNLKNVKNTHGEVLLLVKLQAKSLQLY